MLKKIFFCLLIALFLGQQAAHSRPRIRETDPLTIEEIEILTEQLNSPEVGVRRNALEWLAYNYEVAPPLIPQIAALLGDTTFAPSMTSGFGNGFGGTIGGYASLTLGNIGYQAIPALAEVIQTGTTTAKLNAISSLRRIYDSDVVAPLLLALNDSEEKVRASAASTLKASGQSEYNIEPFINAMQNSSPFVREVAMYLIGHTYIRKGDTEGQRLRAVAVLEALKDRDDKVSKQALTNLLSASINGGWPKYQRQSEALAQLLKHADPKIRRKAAYSLAAYGDARAESTLTLDLKSKDKDTRLDAIHGFARLKSLAPTVTLIDMLAQYDDFNTRRALAYTLAEIGDQRAVEPLFKVIRNEQGGPIPFIREAIEKITGQSIYNHPLWKASLVKKETLTTATP